MLKSIKFSALALASFLGATSAQAALIQNGSFEAVPSGNTVSFDHLGFGYDSKSYTDIVNGNKWGVWASIPGWKSLFGNQIELQMNGISEDGSVNYLKHVGTSFGNTYVELDTHFSTNLADRKTPVPNSPSSDTGIYQTLDNLVVGATYELSFWYRARTNRQGDNLMNVYWMNAGDEANYSNKIVKAVDLASDLSNFDAWQEYKVQLSATSSSMTVGFGAGGDFKWTYPGYKSSDKGSTYGALLDNVALSQVSAPATGLLMLSAAFGFALRRRKQA